MWNAKIHQHLKVHLWHILAKNLPTREKLGTHFQIVDRECIPYEVKVKSCIHLFKHCPMVKALAFSRKWGLRTKLWEAQIIHKWISIYINPPSFDIKEGMGKDLFTMIMGS